MSKFTTALNEQIGHEFFAMQQYVAIAVYYDDILLAEDSLARTPVGDQGAATAAPPAAGGAL
jgi:hypothetical protein